MFGAQAPGLADTPLAERVNARHLNWVEQLPEEPVELWDALTAFDTDSRDALFAHCVSLTVNAVHEAYSRRPKAIAHADRLAEAVSLDMVTAGWAPTVDNYLGRVPKARIVQAVREAKGERAVERIANLKKAEMVAEAEQLLNCTGWLPEPLRTVAIWVPASTMVDEVGSESEPKSVADADNGADEVPVHPTVPEPTQPETIAAE
jgi:ParB family chromosome partitioning protein